MSVSLAPPVKYVAHYYSAARPTYVEKVGHRQEWLRLGAQTIEQARQEAWEGAEAFEQQTGYRVAFVHLYRVEEAEQINRGVLMREQVEKRERAELSRLLKKYGVPESK